MEKIFANIGTAAMFAADAVRKEIAFSGEVLSSLLKRGTHNSASHTVLVRQLYFTSVQILPLFLLVAITAGALIIGTLFQAVKNLGLTEYLGKLLTGFVVTELSPFVIVLLIALRSSSAINTEIAVMKVNGELNALDMLGIDPVCYLFIPRIISVVISMVLLTSLFALVVLFVGLLVSTIVFGTDADAYIAVLSTSVGLSDIITVLFKSAAFGFFIALIPIRSGLNATRELSSIPIAVLNGMIRVFLAIITIEALSLIPRLI
jgi:phospholipid/cholesterol/gamma-HCH transport system permease protein